MVSTLEPETLKKGFIEGYETLDEALSEVLRTMKSDPRVLVIPDGTVTVPNVVE